MARGNVDKTVKKIIDSGSEKKRSKMKADKDLFTTNEINSLIPYIRSMKGQ